MHRQKQLGLLHFVSALECVVFILRGMKLMSSLSSLMNDMKSNIAFFLLCTPTILLQSIWHDFYWLPAAGQLEVRILLFFWVLGFLTWCRISMSSSLHSNSMLIKPTLPVGKAGFPCLSSKKCSAVHTKGGETI